VEFKAIFQGEEGELAHQERSIFVKIEKVNNVGRILFGFGGVFFSLTLMSGAMAPLKYLPAFKDVMVSLSGSPVLGVFIGTTITVLVQASSATISILQNIYQEGLIPLKAALPVLFGDNIGTTIIVTNLFFNTPVRYKFLKKDYTEVGYIDEALRHLALVNKDISFRLTNNGKVLFSTNRKSVNLKMLYIHYMIEKLQKI